MTAQPLSSPPPPPSGSQRRGTGGGVALVILGGIAALLSFGLLAGGSVLMYADRGLRDASGYLTSPTTQLTVPDYALATTNVDVALSNPSWHVSPDALGSVRVTAATRSASGVFLGVAPRNDVLRYLNGVAYDNPTGYVAANGLTYQMHAGGAPADAPAIQSFWAAQASGTGTQTLTWKVASGQWAVVLMNLDASRGVVANVSVGATAPFLFGLALGLLIGGGVALLAAGLLLFGGVALLRPGGARPAGYPPPAWQPGAAPMPPAWETGGLSYPLRFEGLLDQQPSRWLWLVKWLLLIPHFIVLAFLYLTAFVLTVIAFFAILFTGRYPRSIFDFNVAVLRWSWRVSFYGYSALGTDRYPPFSFDAAVDYPATLEVPYPEHLSRGLVLIKWWLLAIPHYIIVAILVGGSTIAVTNAGAQYAVPYTGLITLLVLIAAIAVLFTKRYPRGIFDLAMGLNRWVFRVLVYVLLMRDEYPPFRLDLSGSEPTRAPAAPAVAPPSPMPRPHGA
jgi:hypothetical protein